MQKAMFVEESKARAIHAPVAKWLCGHKLQHQHWLQEDRQYTTLVLCQSDCTDRGCLSIW